MNENELLISEFSSELALLVYKLRLKYPSVKITSDGILFLDGKKVSDIQVE